MGEAARGFWQRAAIDPERIAAIDPHDREVHAGSLLAAANQLVHGLRALGVGRGDRIAVAMSNAREYLELLLATTQAGLYLIPINVGLAATEIAHVIASSGARVIVCDAGTADVVATAADTAALAASARFCTTPRTGFRDIAELKDGQPASAPASRELGEIMFYTSGTTGLPKAVRHELTGDDPDVACDKLARLRIGPMADAPADAVVHLVVAPLYHSAALAWCTAHLHRGHRIVLMPKWTAEGMLARVAEHHVTGSLMVPTHFRRLLALSDEVRQRYDISSLKFIIHGGEPCPVDIKRRMIEWWGPIIHEVYGAAEAASGTYVSPEEWLAKPGTVGKTRGNITILRDDGTRADPREIGAVYFRSKGAKFQYEGEPEKTAQSHRGDDFTVGDIGYVDEDDYLFLTGRKADVIISGGVNIYPAEVEAVLLSHPAVADVAVFGIPDTDWGEQVKAAVQLVRADASSPALIDELIAYCRDRLAPFKRPRTIDFVDELPRDDNGKLYRRRLRAPYWPADSR